MFEPGAAARLSLALAVLALLALPAACGQKGPLYLPKKTKTVITPAAPAASSPENPAPQPAPAK
jgi:predicted small lipoprotein YifL